MPGSVRVPVLSTQTTSTRASTSTAGMSWTSAFFCASRITDTAIATLVSSTRPSGTIVMTPGTVPAMAARMLPSLALYCEMNRKNATGIRAYDTYLMNRWIESRSSERVRLNLLASSAIFEAYESWPTFVARTRPEPATTKEPESTSSPSSFSTESASPVSSDSSSSRPLDSSTTESTCIWSPVRIRITSSTHELVRRDLDLVAVTAYDGLRLADQRELREGPRGAVLLHDADRPC